MTLGYPSVKIHHKATMYWTLQNYTCSILFNLQSGCLYTKNKRELKKEHTLHTSASHKVRPNFAQTVLYDHITTIRYASHSFWHLPSKVSH